MITGPSPFCLEKIILSYKSILLKDAFGPKVLAVYVYIIEEETCTFIHACSISGWGNNIRRTYADLLI